MPSHIPSGAKIIFVGEAPGYQEVQEGEPFVGPSGNLLNRVLHHHAIDRKSVGVTNACLCRPPNNRTPTKLEISCCLPRLKAELEEARPEAVVTMGAVSTAAVLGPNVKISHARAGPPKPPTDNRTFSVIPTWHPAYCLRDGSRFPDLLNDIGKLKSVPSNDPLDAAIHAVYVGEHWPGNNVRVGWEPPVYKVFDDEKAALALKKLHREYTELVIDIETDNPIDKDGSFVRPEQSGILCVGFGYERGKVAVITEAALSMPSVQAEMESLFSDSKMKWIAHNGKFDLAGLGRYGIGRLFCDTMLASYVLDERRGTHGLKYLAGELLGAPNYDEDIKKYLLRQSTFRAIPPDILYKYNAADVACTYDLYTQYNKQMDEGGVRGLHDFLCRASDALMLVEMDGIKVDTAKNAELYEQYEKDIAAQEEFLARWVMNPRSPKQVTEALASLGIRVASTNEETLTELLASSFTLEKYAHGGSEAREFIEGILRNRKSQKFFGTYIKGIRERLVGDRIYPSYLLHGTTTGRLSCRNPNLQNEPRGSVIRSQFVPEDGNIFVQADYRAAELRVMAALAEDPYLLSVFNNGRDLHSEFATTLFGPSFTKDQRARAKSAIFGMAYGMEAYSLARYLDIELVEAKRYVKEFLGMIPATVAWRKRVKHTVFKTDNDLVTPFGRRRRFWLITEDNKIDLEKEAYAFLPQSIASDICLSALCDLKLNYGIDVRVPVHDSILVECKREDADDVAHLMASVMSESARKHFTDYVKFDVETSIGRDWGAV